MSAASAAETQVERGKYLVTISGCGSCCVRLGPSRQADSKRILAGSEVGFGILASVFCRRQPVRRAGLGGWTAEQIIAAITKGEMPNGRKLFPVMPGLTWPPVVGRRPGDRRLPEEPSAGEERRSRTLRTQDVPSALVSVIVLATSAKIPAPNEPTPSGVRREQVKIKKRRHEALDP